LIGEKVKAIVCLGLENEKIHAAFGDKIKTIIDTKSASDAVNAAFQLAEKGDAV